nr:hypothetical protein GCM10020093_071820 [Planobispora longispora]
MHLVPLVDLLDQLVLLSPGAVFVQVGGNLLVFAALGAMLPVRSPRFASIGAVAGVAAGPRSSSSSCSTACAWTG